MLASTIREYLESHREDLASRLFELLRIPSVANDTSQPDQCRRAAGGWPWHVPPISAILSAWITVAVSLGTGWLEGPFVWPGLGKR